MSVAETLLSKIVDANDPQAFVRFGIDRDHFPTEELRKAYDFIRTYADENRGQAPSYAIFTVANPRITYVPAVTDSYEYLTKKLKDDAGKRMFRDLYEHEIPKLYEEAADSQALLSGVASGLERIHAKTKPHTDIGVNLALAGDKFLSEFQARKDGKSFRIWRSKFPSINREIGGYFSGNTYAWYARSGRGKSVLVMEDGAIEPAFQGATVLVWALEMSEYEWMARAYSSISARLGTFRSEYAGGEIETGYENKALLMGKLPEDFEESFAEFLRTLNDKIPGKIILRAADSEGFGTRGVAHLEADITETKADVVVIDPIYLMDYEANTSRVAGGDVAATSVKLKRLAGRTKTVIHVVTQAEEDANEKAEDGTRELRPPKRAELKKSKAILEDAANIFGLDTLNNEGRGVIELGKGRNGGEDTRVELVYLPNYGVVRELVTQESADHFRSDLGF
ncbi:DnaB-like helicase C-terminal domain-containing protein [Paenibacillus sp. YN15]|uniref:DnaB-like helicase C-terminal domain-containing protein n=1 Tax=Paenibacillus sp. YN15 TaxID=1742774 RepID=UPI000DCB3F23|nr:DnaB-like helicase C-terminal domain-containing protein [Paenibacillus sp. YN15]RAU96798.1 DNA helicase [Paenibacillus sp. YN15]